MNEGAKAGAEESTAAGWEAAPTDLGEVADTLLGTILEAWSAFVAHLPYLLVGFFVLLAAWGVSSIAGRALARVMKRRSDLSPSMRELANRLLHISIWALGATLAAMVVFPGLTPARALGFLGLFSVAVGFAFKDIFENFFAGILILWRFPFEPGDFIECNGIEGRVEDVTIRMTRIRRTTGELVVVPNSILFKNPIDVLTDQPRRRVTVMTGVAYDEDVSEAVGVIEKAVKSCGTVSQDEPVQIFPQAFGASSIDIEVTWWTDPEPVDIRRSRGEVVSAVKKALDEAGIEIPFPYRTLTFKEPLPLRSQANGSAGSES